MIVGRGMLAKAFSNYLYDKDIIIFASGVSNSNEVEYLSFQREKKLLLDVLRNNQDRLIVYFSTCSIYDSTLQNSKYVLHKLSMEQLIYKNCKKYLILRLPQVVGYTTSPTIINFLYNNILHGNEFKIFSKSKRNIIDVEDVFNITDNILKENMFANSIINLASPICTSIFELVSILEELLCKRASYKIEIKGSFYHIDVSHLDTICSKLEISFDKDYVRRIIYKYFS